MDRSVTHSDLEPDNIMTTDAGGVTVLDFGIEFLGREQKLGALGSFGTRTRRAKKKAGIAGNS